jgi:hypothetical protein
MHVRRTLAALFAASCLLSGCGGTSSAADPPVSGSPTSPAPTTHPPAHESPQHFIRRFALIEEAMENTGNLGPYVALARGCHACLDLAHQVRSFFRAGGYVRWDGWEIRGIAPYTSGPDGESFAVKVHSAATAFRKSSSGPIHHLDGGPATEIVTLKRSGHSWVVVGRARLSG